MQKIFCYLLVALLTIVSLPALADHTFCCADSNWQQEMLAQYHNPQQDRTDFSYPSGKFRTACQNCQYDLSIVSCYCQDVSGLTSVFPTYFTLDQCQNVYDNRGGFLKCGD